MIEEFEDFPRYLKNIKFLEKILYYFEENLKDLKTFREY
jgi:hypothetical protein